MNSRPLLPVLLLLLLAGCGDPDLEKVEPRRKGAEAVVDRDAVLAALGAHVRARRASGSFRGLEREWLVTDGGWSRADLERLDQVLHEERLAQRLLQQAMGKHRWTMEDAKDEKEGLDWTAKSDLVKSIAGAFEAGDPAAALTLVREAEVSTD